jgi:hypothetical protein
MHKLVGQAFMAVIGALLLLSIYQGKRDTARQTGELSFSPFLYTLGGSCAVFAVFPVAMTLFANDRGQYVVKGILVVGFGIVAALCFASAFVTRGKFDDQGIEFRTLFRRRRCGSWNDLLSVKYNQGCGWHVLTFRDGFKIRLSDWLGGSVAALDMARSRSNCSFQRTRYARR